MPLQLLDIILAVALLISGLLALARGFTREVLSLIAWAAAGLAAFGAVMTPGILGLVEAHVQPEIVAKVGLGAGVFLIVLVIVSLIGVKIADFVLDSAAGPFDRTLGLAYGLARGLMLVVIAYLFYIWLVPGDKREGWIRNARSLPLIESTAGVVIGFLPPDVTEMLRSKMAVVYGANPTAQPEEGYGAGQTRGLNQLIEGSGTEAVAPEGPTTETTVVPPATSNTGGTGSTGQ